MKNLFSILICSGLLLSTACGPDAESRQAAEEGQRLAVEIGSRTYKNEMELQKAMFEVVTVRSDFQMNKSDKAVESFSTAFENKLREVNDSLATIILGPDA